MSAPEETELDVEDMPEAIRKLRGRFLCDLDAEVLDAEAEQLFLLALGALENAERFAKLAVYKTRQMRASTGR